MSKLLNPDDPGFPAQMKAFFSKYPELAPEPGSPDALVMVIGSKSRISAKQRIGRQKRRTVGRGDA